MSSSRITGPNTPTPGLSSVFPASNTNNVFRLTNSPAANRQNASDPYAQSSMSLDLSGMMNQMLSQVLMMVSMMIQMIANILGSSMGGMPTSPDGSMGGDGSGLPGDGTALPEDPAGGGSAPLPSDPGTDGSAPTGDAPTDGGATGSPTCCSGSCGCCPTSGGSPTPSSPPPTSGPPPTPTPDPTPAPVGGGDAPPPTTGGRPHVDKPAGQVTPGNQNAYDDLINQAAKKYGVDPLLIKAVIRQESDFDPDCISPSGCKGLMQLSPSTATELGAPPGASLYDPAVNIDLGTKYLKQMIDLKKDVRVACMAYNAGPNASFDNATPSGQDHPAGVYADLVLGWYADLKKTGKVDTTLGAKPTCPPATV